MRASDAVQDEDHRLCEMVQGGLASDGYDTGRYAPEVEAPMHHFHQLYYRAMKNWEGGGAAGGEGSGSDSDTDSN